MCINDLKSQKIIKIMCVYVNDIYIDLSFYFDIHISHLR